jgi:hypothetical protein
MVERDSDNPILIIKEARRVDGVVIQLIDSDVIDIITVEISGGNSEGLGCNYSKEDVLVLGSGDYEKGLDQILNAYLNADLKDIDIVNAFGEDGLLKHRIEQLKEEINS